MSTINAHPHKHQVGENGRPIAVRGCPVCESNIRFVQAITREGCTTEEYDNAKALYLLEGRPWHIASGITVTPPATELEVQEAKQLFTIWQLKLKLGDVNA